MVGVFKKSYFVPENYVLNGKIYFQGERFEDRGVICVKNNQVQILNDVMGFLENQMVIVVSMNSEEKVEMEFASFLHSY